MATKTFICLHCGQEFTRRAFPSQLRDYKFCSATCRNKARIKPLVPCPICGTMFKSIRINGKSNPPKTYCSRKCAATAKIGLRYPYNPRVNDNIDLNVPRTEILKFIQDNYQRMTNKQLADTCGITDKAVAQLLNKRLKVKRTPEERQVLQYSSVSDYMTKNNPMFNASTVSKVSQYWVNHPFEWKEIQRKLNEGKQKLQRDKPSKLEFRLRQYLDELGINYEPSAMLKDKFIVDIRIGDLIIEADGDYWHGHPRFYPLTKRQFDQQRRDASRNKYLTTCGYTVVRIWESDMSMECVKMILMEHGLI